MFSSVFLKSRRLLQLALNNVKKGNAKLSATARSKPVQQLSSNSDCSPLQLKHQRRNLPSCSIISSTMENQQMSIHVKCDSASTSEMEPGVGAAAEPACSTSNNSDQNQPTMSKRAMKRQARAQHFRDLKKQKRAHNSQTLREDAGYNLVEFDKTSYYFENGLRKVYPYHYVFSTYAKGRWVGRTLRNVLEKEFGFDEPADVDKAFNQGKIHVNGIQVSVDYEVKDCDYISHQVHRHENPVTNCPLEILVDTDDVVVINKPSSIPCHPCGRYRFNSVVFILGKEMGYSNLRNIYRLDRLTSGVLVLGKTAKTTKKLEDQVANRQVQKEYVCRVMGEFPSETLTVDQPLQALSNKLRLQIVSPAGKSSQTTFTRLSYNGRSSVVKCAPKTGRTHQIRVHLQFLGHPIINDVFYNSNAWGPNKGKGGVHEISTDTVCETIMKRHQATQWEGGENPQFYDKLKEMQENDQLDEQKQGQQQQAIESTTNTKSQEDCSINGPGKIESKGSDASVNDLIKERLELGASNSRVDCGKGDAGDSQVTDKNDKECAQVTDNTADHCEKIDNADNTSIHGNAQEEISSNTNAIVEKTTSTSAEDGTCTETQQTRPGFEWTKWQVDSSCDMCRKLTLEPKPQDLIMFLHALKYKGPDWEYETELPDWAHEDWQDEDQYMLEESIDER